MNIAQLHALFQSSTGISTDTRNLKKDNLFFCLRGDNFNGNSFTEQALQLGAKYVIYDDVTFKPENTQQGILVSNSLDTLQKLAQYHRRQFNIPVIGLTGSNGKTTTKELIKSVLSQAYEVHATQGNFNNHIGVPLTLLGIKESTEIALIEMGANHLNEIKTLCHIAEPTLGYITNFGKAHLEGFGSLAGVIKGKSELYQFIAKHKGTTIINSDDPTQLKEVKSELKWCFGATKEADIQLSNDINESGYCSVYVNNTIIESQLTGSYNWANLNTAVALGFYFNLTLDLITKGINIYCPTNNRSQWVKTANNDVLLDAYNANPTSMSAALESFINYEANSKGILLGDMLELGSFAIEEHKSIIDKIVTQNFDFIFLVGPLFKQANTHKNVTCFDNSNEVKTFLKKHPFKRKTILIKGSRGIALEQLLEHL